MSTVGEITASPPAPACKTDRPNRLVGTPITRVEDRRFLTGKATYVDDIEPPDTLHVAFTRSTVAHGTLEAIETAEAHAVDGVVEVVQREVRETLETLGERQRVGCVAAQSLHREWRSDENDGRFVVHSTRGVVDGTDVRKSGV